MQSALDRSSGFAADPARPRVLHAQPQHAAPACDRRPDAERTGRVVRKGLLAFTRQFLFMKLAGQVLLVHVALVITGAAFTASSMHTYHISRTPLPDTLTPNQRTAILAKRWREERNFWIATLTFLLWGLLYRFYALAIDHVALRDRVRQLELAAVGATRGSTVTGSRAPASSTAGKGAAVEASAPPAPAEMLSGGKEEKKSK